MSLSPVQKATAPEAVVQQPAVVAEQVAVQNPVTEVAQKALAKAPVAAEKSLCDRFCTWVKELFDRIFCCFKSAKKEETKAEETPAAKANQVAADALQKQVTDAQTQAEQPAPAVVPQAQTEQQAPVVVPQAQAEQPQASTGDVPPPPPASTAPTTTVVKNKTLVQESTTAVKPAEAPKGPLSTSSFADELKLKFEKMAAAKAAKAAKEAEVKA